jgi:hypothetical protein
MVSMDLGVIVAPTIVAARAMESVNLWQNMHIIVVGVVEEKLIFDAATSAQATLSSYCTALRM